MHSTDTGERRLLDRRRFMVAGLGALLAACAGTAGDLDGAASPTAGASSSGSTSPDPTSSASPSRAAAPTPTPSPTATQEDFDITSTPSGTDLPTGIVPTTVVIPAIGVDARCIELQLTADEVEVPEDFDDAGWWVQTRQPGEIGPAVIGGHVDSTTGPAVFFRLDQLRTGDEVTVRDGAGDTRTFVVSRDPIRVKKDERPPEVFGFGQGRPELRLITCGGDFDPNARSYVDNVVVFCHDPTFQA